jgi:hypothetical protein
MFTMSHTVKMSPAHHGGLDFMGLKLAVGLVMALQKDPNPRRARWALRAVRPRAAATVE